MPYTIVQIGLGCVGSAYLEAFAAHGHTVIGIEKNYEIAFRIAMANKWQNVHICMGTPDLQRCVQQTDSKAERLSNELMEVQNGEFKPYVIPQHIDFIMIAVNTPISKLTKWLDMSALFSTVYLVAALVTHGSKLCQTTRVGIPQVVLRSTVNPGTTIEYASWLHTIAGFEVSVVFQPEFLRAASNIDDALHPWSVVIGHNGHTSIDKLKGLYAEYNDQCTEMTIAEAELLKLYHNGFNALKISYFNQCAALSAAVGTIDQKVIEHALNHTCEGLINSKYGTESGHAYAGGCLPKDSQLYATLEGHYRLPKLMRAAVQVNAQAPADTADIPVAPNHMPAEMMK